MSGHEVTHTAAAATRWQREGMGFGGCIDGSREGASSGDVYMRAIARSKRDAAATGERCADGKMRPRENAVARQTSGS